MKKGIRWLIKMFYNTGNEKVTEKIFLRAMISSVLGIILCTVCLAGMTWAWFSDSVTSHSSNITSASFSVKVTVNKGTYNTEIPLTGYMLEQSSEKYKVTLEATGTASTVYCKVNINEVIYTARLNLNSNNAPFIFEFEIDCSAKSATVTFTPTWSNSGSSENSNTWPSNDTIEVK